jgi:hypothetical protein
VLTKDEANVTAMLPAQLLFNSRLIVRKKGKTEGDCFPHQ